MLTEGNDQKPTNAKEIRGYLQSCSKPARFGLREIVRIITNSPMTYPIFNPRHIQMYP